MTETKPDYVELKSNGPSPTTLASPVELKVPAKPERPRYVLYNWLASLALTISIISLIFYLAFHFSGLLITFSALGTIAVGAGCFFSYLAISRIDPKKQTYAFVAFCLAAGLCFTASVISLNFVFHDYKPVSNIAFTSKPAPEPAFVPIARPVLTSPPSEPVKTPYAEPAYNPNIEPVHTDGGGTDSYNVYNIDSPVASDATGYTTYEPYGGFAPYSGSAYPYPYNYGNSYSFSTSYSNSYTYWYSYPYSYSISYSYSYSTSSSPYGSNYYVDTRTSYDNYSPYGQPSYSNQYSYSGSSNGYVAYDPANLMPLNSSIYGEPHSLDNSSVPAREPMEEPVSGSVSNQSDEPIDNVDEGNNNSSSPDSPVEKKKRTRDSAKPDQDSNSKSISNSPDNVTQSPPDSILVDPNVAFTSPVYYPPHANDDPLPSGNVGSGYAGYMPAYHPGSTSSYYGGYSSYSSSSSYSNSYTYSYSDPYPYSISYSYSYSTSDSTYGSSYSVFSSSNYDNFSPYGQPSYSTQYSYSSSSGNGGNDYPYTYNLYLRPQYAYPAYEPAYTTYEPYTYNYNSYNPNVDPSYAYTTYEPYYYNTYGREDAQAQPSPYSRTGNAYDYPPDAANVPPTRFYKPNNVHTSGISSVTIPLAVLLFIIKTLLFVALITQAHEIKTALKQGKQVALEESAIKSESQII